ncbi:Universal stress protein UspA and related nucleotide-binding protein [Marinobacterium lacunae]|uniref:Universal stress protein UspA and related nucleotide-binding protein n=1 Tax=Marinobacterium lacunae TaxID=1232683 RepID=A0A081FYD1_9GAMM|nr:universal stress protein [Marinobacterium lacunae]KEA63536.1 Universal stress protein UspA and related nucleotide-binding protein [Marinobacterium lacunae]MBR9886055.1 universal stress protein [Oceanospirillales bacterium]
MFKRILLPADGSEGAFKALKLAVELRKVHDAELMILSVFRHHSLREASMSMVRPRDPEHMDDLMKSYAREVAESFKRYALEQECPGVRAFVKSGHTAKTIVEFAEKNDVDLIIVGSHGLGEAEQLLVGSVSQKVVGMAKCPVLVV